GESQYRPVMPAPARRNRCGCRRVRVLGSLPNPLAPLPRGQPCKRPRASREASTMTILKILGLFALLGSFAVATTGCENTARGSGAGREQARQDLQNLDHA